MWRAKRSQSSGAAPEESKRHYKRSLWKALVGCGAREKVPGPRALGAAPEEPKRH